MSNNNRMLSVAAAMGDKVSLGAGGFADTISAAFGNRWRRPSDLTASSSENKQRPREISPVAQNQKKDPGMTPSTPAAIASEIAHLYAALERQMQTTTRNIADAALARVSEEGATDYEPRRGGYTLGVTSAVRGEGKTTIALHLALAAARDSGRRVCLVDLGLGDNDVCHNLGLEAKDNGCVQCVESGTDLYLIRLTNCDDLFILPSGKAPQNPARTVRSNRITEVIDAVREAFDLVIVDMPAVATDNVQPLLPYLDGAVVVASAGATPRRLVAEALHIVGAEKALGVALNRMASATPEWIRCRFAPTRLFS